MTIAITGAAGQLGRLTAQLVLDRVPPGELVLVTRRPDAHRRPRRGGRDRPSRRLRRARLAAGGLRRRRPPAADQHRRARQPGAPSTRAAIEAAAAAGVGHVIYTSIVNAGSELPLVVSHEHGATEHAIRDRGLRWTALRNGLYAEFQVAAAARAVAVGRARAQQRRRRDRLRLARGLRRGRCGVLTTDGHEDRVYDITGPELVTQAQFAALVTETHRPPDRGGRDRRRRRPRRASSPPACRPRPRRPTRRSAPRSAKACWTASAPPSTTSPAARPVACATCSKPIDPSSRRPHDPPDQPPVPRRPRRLASCAPPSSSTPETSTPPGASTPTSCAPSRTTRSATSCASRRRSGCSRPPTASSAARRGTWTSSTRSAGSRTPRSTSRSSSTTRTGRSRGSRRRCTSPSASRCKEPIFADALHLPAVVRDDGDAEAHDPLPQHGPLPRRARGDQRRRLPRHGRLLERPDVGLRRRGPRAGRARLHLPAVRRHEPRLPQRSQAARARHRARRRRRAPARGLHPPHQRGARGPPRGHDRHRRTCAAATSAPRGWPQGGYDFVAEALFNELEVDGFFLEYDDARSGGFEPLRFVPKGKYVVLGLVTTKRGELESEDDSSAASRRPAATSTSTSSASRRSAASPRPSRATRSPRTSSGTSSPDRRDGARGLGLAGRPGQLGRRRAFGWWRAGPVAGHGLRLRKLRLTRVSAATRPNAVLAWPGSTVRVAVRSRLLLCVLSSCAGLLRAALRPSDAATWSASASASHRVRSRSPRTTTRHRWTPQLAITAARPTQAAAVAYSSESGSADQRDGGRSVAWIGTVLVGDFPAAVARRKQEHLSRALSALGSTRRIQKHARPYVASVLQRPARVTTQPRPCVAFVLADSAARGSQWALRRRGAAECGFDSFEPAVELTELLRQRRLGIRGRPLTP